MKALLLLLSCASLSPCLAEEQQGIASWYGHKFHGRKTASGERFDMHALTAAHRTLPFGTQVEVCRGEVSCVTVRINDRGPFHRRRLIDLSWAAANTIGLTHAGEAQVRLRWPSPQTSPECPAEAPATLAGNWYWLTPTLTDAKQAANWVKIHQNSFPANFGAFCVSVKNGVRLRIGPFEDAIAAQLAPEMFPVLQQEGAELLQPEAADTSVITSGGSEPTSPEMLPR